VVLSAGGSSVIDKPGGKVEIITGVNVFGSSGSMSLHSDTGKSSGYISLKSGNALGTLSGDLTFASGAGNHSSGNLLFESGPGYEAGNLTLRGGVGVNNGGSVEIVGGSSNKTAGSVFLIAGSGTFNGNGGSVSIVPGQSENGSGGNFEVVAGSR
jgi:hypothetical protein